jgi:glutamate carboxypeptidase
MSEYAPYLSYIDSQYEHMKQLTYNWSKINSGSYHIEGLDAMRVTLEDNFHWLDAEMECLSLAPLQQISKQGEIIEVPIADALRFRKRPDAPIQVFLGGHYDTVFGKDHPFQKPVLIDDNTINGPGVADLKGGLVVMLKALEALEQSPFKDSIGWEILLNPDEEIGSISSDKYLKQAAQRCDFGLIYEPSLPDGTIVGARKGSGNFTLTVRGKAAHAGREHHLGRNAIVKLAEATQAINALNGRCEGVTINPGIIHGGSALNAVPDLAIMRYNIRINDATQQAWVTDAINEIIATFNQDTDYQLSLHGAFTRPPKVLDSRDDALWNGLKSCGVMLNLPINQRATGGCCDGNNLKAYGLSNIDTLGVRGGNIHSDKEFIILESLKERAQLSALLLMRVANGEITL